MPPLISLEIAAVCLNISCRDSVIIEDFDPAYQTFLKPEANPAVADIDIDLELNTMPDTKGMMKIFDSEQSWSMFWEGNNYYMALNSPISEKPFWISKMNRDFTKITVYCSSELIHTKEDHMVISNPVRYPLDQIILMYYLARRGGVLIHAAGIKMNGNGYIFAGRSGAGKTTISRQFVAKGYSDMLSDDRVVVRKIGNLFRIYGTPWPGEGGIAINKSFPFAGIFFLSHGDSNRIEELNPQKVLERLLPVVSVPWYDSETMTTILSFCEDLISRIPTHTLHFRPDKEVVDVLEKSISY